MEIPCRDMHTTAFSQPFFSANVFSGACTTDAVRWTGREATFSITFGSGGSAAFMTALEAVLAATQAPLALAPVALACAAVKNVVFVAETKKML